jgi:integrase/recombinase XerD
MPVIKERMPNGEGSISVTDESGTPVAVVSSFLAYLSARECSPNTSIAYAHDVSPVCFSVLGPVTPNRRCC